MNPSGSVFERFLSVAERVPDEPAIWWQGEVFSYQRCADTALALASWLTAEVGPGGMAAINLPKQPQTILLMLACLGSGVTYVPIDPAAPRYRRQQILEDSRPQMVLLSSASRAESSVAELAEPTPPVVRRLLGADILAARLGDGVLDDRPELAYILYTSGSTGIPKGVMTTPANMTYFVDWSSSAFPVGPGDRIAIHAPLHFDLPVYDIYVSLTSGGCIYPMDEKTVLLPSATHRFLHEHAITSVYAVPSSYVAMLNRSTLPELGLPDLRQLLYGGEEFHIRPLRQLVEALPSSTRIYNVYGPTETNVVTWYEITDVVWTMDRVPIGPPVPGTEIRVLVNDQFADESGVDGELVVSGPSVSPGYLGDPGKTGSSRIAGGYRTGDIGRFDEEGNLWFLGRRDGLVKTRGFRVELGDVEAAILQHPGVAEAAVLPASRPEVGPVLKAYVVPVAGVDLSPATIKQWVAGLRPNHMVPVFVEVREDLPRTSTGKIFRSALTELAP